MFGTSVARSKSSYAAQLEISRMDWCTETRVCDKLCAHTVGLDYSHCVFRDSLKTALLSNALTHGSM